MGVLLFCIVQSCFAATWLQQFSVPVSLDYDTNPLMADTNVTSIWKSTFTPHYYVKRVQNLDEVYADVALRIERTSDRSIMIDREDPSLTVGWRHELETGQIGVRLGYDEVSSRSSSLDETGRAGGDSTRITRSLGLNFQKMVTEKFSVAINGSRSRAVFNQEGGGAAASAGNHSYSTSARLGYQYAELMQPYVQLSANRYVPDVGLLGATNLYGISLGVDWSISDRVQAGLFAGENWISGSASDQGWQGGGNFTYALEKTLTTLSISRSISPAGNGGFLESDQLSASWRVDLSDKSSAGIDLSFRKNIGDEQSRNNRFGCWYSRSLTPDWGLRASYQYRQAIGQQSNAHGSLLGVSVTYNFSEL